MLARPVVTVRPPLPGELVVCRRLLPHAAAEGHRRSFRLALQADGKIAGAASWREYPERTGDLQLRILPAFRSQGAGRQLVQVVLAEETRRGSRRAEAWVDRTLHPDAEPFLHALGFATEDVLTTVESDIFPMLERLETMLEYLRARRRIPTEARVCRLAEAPAEPLARLYGEFINRNPGFRTDVFAARLDPEQYPVSTVVQVGDEVAGFLLAYVEGELTLGPARIVAPRFRGGWVNPLMIHASLVLSRDAGARRSRFDFWSDNQDTLRLSQRFRAQVVRTQVLMALSLPTPVPTPTAPTYAAL